jgi:hypothetical protein
MEGKQNLLMFLMWKVFVLGFVVVKQRLNWCVVCMSELSSGFVFFFFSFSCVNTFNQRFLFFLR